ncbi:hypothetical protein BD410DRAFT_790941 [Rickenella mellea]|uniref:Uncharacterized protein n=1 Tax=Rickenella mellea TaxID=50990 RepID=A0A4Y7PYF3_9AGAM|nr:hypothetical protein BD410DRAFT_790941 [Rickenella mellea]
MIPDSSPKLKPEPSPRLPACTYTTYFHIPLAPPCPSRIITYTTTSSRTITPPPPPTGT